MTVNPLKRKHETIELSSYRDQQFKVSNLDPFNKNLLNNKNLAFTQDYLTLLFAIQGSRDEQEKLLHDSTTLYIGNLSFYTTEEQIYELFGKCGEIKRVVVGLDRVRKTPCGFCFVEYHTKKDALNAMRYVNGTRLDDRIIRTDWDTGFIEGRQYGRGKSGGQVRDEYRTDYDAGRGGYGSL